MSPAYYAFSSSGGDLAYAPGADSLERQVHEVLRGTYLGTPDVQAFGIGAEFQETPGSSQSEDAIWTPLPFVHFVVKVVSRCNIACSYCYMYEHADQGWRTQPRRMSAETEAALIGRIDDYLTERSVDRTTVILHGGEPLLYGAPAIDRFARRVRDLGARRGAEIGLMVQTNATMVNERFIDVFVRHRIGVGISLDGPPDAQDSKRRDRNGRGTYDRTAAGLRRLQKAAADGRPPPAITAVIDPATHPGELLDHFGALGVSQVDFQLPNFNHDSYPHGRWPLGAFGRWLVGLYDELRRTPRSVRVRSMELLVGLVIGTPYGGDILGARSFGQLIIDTDGSYQAHDSLRATVDGAAATGTSVWTDSIGSLETHPMVLAYTDKASGVGPVCRACHLFAICGGGLVSHRYRSGAGYANPSVYCADLAMLIRHVAADIERMRHQQAVVA